MHIGLLAPSWPAGDAPSGVVTYVHHLKGGLEAAGHRVSVVAAMLQKTGPPARDAHLVRPTLARRLRNRVLGRLGLAERSWEDDFGLSLAETVARLHRRCPFDVFEMEESFGWAAEVADAAPVPVVVKLHGPAYRTASGDADRIEREGRGLRGATAVTAPAASTLADTLERYALRPRVAERVRNPMPSRPDLPAWTLAGCEPATILFVGRFDQLKGGDTVLQAFEHVAAERRDARLVFVGPDDGIADETGALEPFERVRARMAGSAAERVSFRGRLPPADVEALRTTALVTVVASRWENQSYTALEAMLQGCPLVSTAVGGHRELIEDGVTGLLVPAGDPAAMAAALLRLMADHALAVALGRRAREHVLHAHAPARVAEQTLAVYRRCGAR